MATNLNNIVTLLEPSHKFKQLEIGSVDLELVDDNEVQPYAVNTTEYEGKYLPVIFINNFKLTERHIINMELNFINSLPSLRISFVDYDYIFDIEAPISIKNVDKLSIYIRSGDVENIKPIRLDFTILDIVNTGTRSNRKTYYIDGLLDIPNFFNDYTKGFDKDTSFNHLLKITEELGLGFSSNESNTDDEMIRIKSEESYEKFISSLVNSSYKDENSFFDWFIDEYFYLNFVNVYKQITSKKEMLDSNINSAFSYDILHMNKSDIENLIGSKLFLTNNEAYIGKNNFILNYKINNESNWKFHGGGYNTYIYDINTSDLLDNQILNYDINKNDEVDNVDYIKNQQRSVWIGKQEGVSVGGNVHDSFNHAKLTNKLRLNKLDDFKMVVDINGLYLYIQKYMIIPIFIYETYDNFTKSATLKVRDDLKEHKDDIEENGGENFVLQGHVLNQQGGVIKKHLNKYISGYYLVKGIRYIYTKGDYIKTQLILTKTEFGDNVFSKK